MCIDEKIHHINVAYDLISNVYNDTDEGTWAFEDLNQALISLSEWFEDTDK